MLNSECSKLTSKFLTTLSTRLSSRLELKSEEYQIEIGEDFVHMNPVVYVFPDTHHRKDSDKASVLNYLVSKFFPEISLDDKIVNDTIKISPDSLVSGTYRYQLYKFAKRRKWVRIS